jgi:hypothetical protein
VPAEGWAKRTGHTIVRRGGISWMAKAPKTPRSTSEHPHRCRGVLSPHDVSERKGQSEETLGGARNSQAIAASSEPGA